MYNKNNKKETLETEERPEVVNKEAQVPLYFFIKLPKIKSVII